MSDATKPPECEVCSRRGGEICNCLDWAISQVDPVYEPGRSSARKALAALRQRCEQAERERDGERERCIGIVRGIRWNTDHLELGLAGLIDDGLGQFRDEIIRRIAAGRQEVERG